ncbi:hypothetical protein PUN28_004033 [Cardiocondyla obscurior]
MDEYEKKFSEMQKYIPFLEAMIERLQNVKGSKEKDNREIQLQKMQSLHGVLSNSKRKLKIETLQRCEDVLQKLYNRVEKGNTSSLHSPFRDNDDVTLLPSTSSEKSKSNQCNALQHTKKDKRTEETPQSPDTVRSSSPECEILPIIIPTERSTEFNKRRQKQRQEKIPLITLTDSEKPETISSSTDSTSDDVTVAETWNLLEQSERYGSRRNRKNRQLSMGATSNDVATAAKKVSNSLPQRVSDNRNYSLNPEDIPTVPVPSLGGSRRLSSVLQKSRLNLNIAANNSSRMESPVNISEVRLGSPGPEILFTNSVASPPRSTDSHSTRIPSKPLSAPLLFSPPLPHENPLSMEDLAELLNDQTDNDKRDKANENAKNKKDETDKTSKNVLSSEREKLTVKKNLLNTPRVSSTKSNEIKGPPHQSNDSQRSQTSFLGSKFQEPRYADNYERHPRQRDAHAHETAKDNTAAKSTEKNPLYQRRPSVTPEARNMTEDVLPSREDEFVINNSDYYNMHANQMHWGSSTGTGDNQFGNNQWASTYIPPVPPAVMANPSLQPNQLSFPIAPMDTQFMQNQFPSTLPAGSMTLINPAVRPQEMSHMVRPESVIENVTPVISPGFPQQAPPFPQQAPTFPQQAPTFPSQFRNFQMGQGSYDPAFSVARLTEYPLVGSTWDGCGIQVENNATGISYPRPNTPCPWGTRDRGNRNPGREGYYDRNNRSDVRPGFNRDKRRTDWPRDGHTDRENPNRFSNRDPRVRTEHSTSVSPTKETGTSSVRDPRLAKDKNVSPIKSKDTVHNERDSKKWPVTSNTTKEKSNLQKSPEKEKLELPKDRMQSPLESLYGAIDTKASQKSGLQKFKIPKIKRPEVPQSNRVSNETKKAGSASLKSSRIKNSNNSSGKNINKSNSKNKSKDVASAEVSSSSDSNRATEKSSAQQYKGKNTKGKKSNLSLENSKNEINISEADSVTNCKYNDVAKKGKKAETEDDGSKSKGEITQEWIEEFIKKTIESGESSKKLAKGAKIVDRFEKLLKVKQLQKILDSDCESSSSNEDETVKTKKTQIKKKRLAIVSDSSDDESLAERLNSLTTTNTNIEIESSAQDSTISTHLEKEVTKNINAKEKNYLLETDDEEHIERDDKDVRREENDSTNDRLGDNNKNIQSENGKQISNSKLKDNKKEIQTVDKNDQCIIQKLQDNAENIESLEQSGIESSDQDKNQTLNSVSDITNSQELLCDKPKAKTKRRNSLEMLQEDIREMFISEGVVTATGYRMCRLKESQSPATISSSINSTNSKKDEILNTTELNNTDTNESVASSTKPTKKLRSRTIEKSNKSKIKNKKNTKHARNLRFKKTNISSDSEEDQPLALRTEKLQTSADNINQEVDYNEESNDIFRRSKRSLNKDIMEPFVTVERTDIAKIDTSKVMFDSSSDESFSIDVSVLTAAVDNSLRRDKQSDQDSVDTVSSKQKGTKGANKRTSKSKKFPDNKSEDGISFTDEESVISNMSMSSSVTIPLGSGAARTTAREELLSNILMGIVPEKNTLIDKGDEADFEEDANDPLAIEPNVKKSVKKKKKKSNWKMGIVTTKRKKKKITSGASSKTAPTNTEETTILPEAVEADQLILKNKEFIKEEKTDYEKNSGDYDYDEANDSMVNSIVDSIVKYEDIKPFVKMEDFNLSSFNLSQSTNIPAKETLNDSFAIPECKPTIKMEVEEPASTSDPDPTAANVVTENTFFKEPPKIVYDQVMTELSQRIDNKYLMDYAWGGQDKYKCLICFFTGKNIVHHYKTSHAGKEVLISRLKYTDAQDAIMDVERATSSSTTETSQMCTFRCRFCHSAFLTEDATDVALEAFYEHCTTHTGEYRFHCNNCSYQTVAKASMRTHYYKMCRKENKTFNDSASEDIVPRESGIYGYLCSSCNYVQLKRQNVETHVTFWHREQPDTEIIKINMSVATPQQPKSNEQVQESAKTDESFAVETKPQVSEIAVTDIAELTESNDNIDNANESIPREPEVEKNVQIKQEENEERPKLSQGEPEGSVSTGNLSAFVCPPELENKEIEIQRERQKTMQEIANDIGILLKNSKSDFSIIDKLQDKMRTEVAVSSSSDCNDSINVAETTEKSSLSFAESSEKCLNTEELIIKEPSSSQSSSQENHTFTEEMLADKEIINSENNKDNKDDEKNKDDKNNKDDENNKDDNDDKDDKKNKLDKVDVKIRDPLATMDPCNDNESDGEINNECAAPIFDSDSSSEQSDSEQTDVNMILKETSNIDASSSRDPILTTIQRLAAQLQNVKPLEPVPEPMSDLMSDPLSDPLSDPMLDPTPDPTLDPTPDPTLDPTPDPMLDIKKEIKTEPESFIPKPPDVVPISNVKHLLTKQQTVKSSEKETSSTSCKNADSSASFIRFRRLSGDMLSTLQFEDTGEGLQECNTDGAQSISAINARTDAEEECSFLKIENVVSLAPTFDQKEGVTASSVSDIKITEVEGSSAKFKEIPPLILRKPIQPLILKKNISLSLLTSTNVQVLKTQPVATSSKNSSPISLLNYRRKKVIHSTVPINSKDVSLSTAASKLKSAEAYAAMLTEPKLVHFFKCMGHNCSYTTDSHKLYAQHYAQHASSVKQKSTEPHDYQKCAYCYTSLNDFVSMKAHLWEKHSHCQYQCGYCFYRAIVPSYVQQHQTIYHPGTVFYYLKGDTQKQPQKEENINRSAFIIPFVCKHDCDRIFYTREAFVSHLRNNHSAFQQMYICHACTSTHRTIEALLSHYKSHGFCKYQCSYCVHGEENLNEMHQHLSAFHYDRLPHVLERSLPPEPSYEVEIIHQLILRTLDYDLNTENKNNTVIKDTTDEQISTASLDIENSLNEILSKAREGDSVGGVKSDLKKTKANPSRIAIKLFKTVCKPATVSPASTNEKMSSILIKKQPVQNKLLLLSETEKVNDYTTNQILQEPKMELSMSMSDSDAVDPLECSSEFNCNDEFVNTNLLDNAELLKNFVPDASTFFKSVDKIEDSDVEILESEDKFISCKDVEGDAKKKTEPLFVEVKIMNKEQVSSNNVGIKSTSEESSSDVTSNATAQSDKLLTLDDIKDTGLTKNELYKCGYINCNFTASHAILLKTHIKGCTYENFSKVLICPHCKKRLSKIYMYFEHLKLHGLKRFGCSKCKMRYTVPFQAKAHMKSKHKCNNTKIVPADPTNPSQDGLFIIQEVAFGAGERKTKKRKGAKSGVEQENDKTANNEKLLFGPDEIEQLPRQAIYNREVQCAVCPYKTKVRTNIVRHLQLHAKDETVPESGPVNPVPCLDKKEKMFDKMVNLASSSHQNGRMGAKPKESVKESEEIDGLPKFVPESERYVCGVAECNYLSMDEAMLRYHLKALHSEEPYFHCPHCPPPQAGQESQNIAIDKMGIHLKMHDARLYKCSHCNHHHYHSIKMSSRHVVERHLSDKHPEKFTFVKIVREIENTENVQQSSVQEETEEEVPDPDGNHWKCNICDFKCVLKADVVNHTDTVHGENCQYKCTLCTFKTSGKAPLEQHINNKHAGDSNADYTVIYQRIKGINKRNTETITQGGQDEPFDTTPLWQRNMPRVRHIRGILFEEEIETPSTSDTSSASSKLSLNKRKSETDIVTKPAKIKCTGKSSSLDENNRQSKEKSKRSLSCDKLSGEADDEESDISKTDLYELNDVNDSDTGRFGPYGKPEENMYVCTLCSHFRTKYKHDIRDHLYRELKYPRWHCKTCGYLSINRKTLLQHLSKRHSGECAEYEPLSPDNAIEDWVETLLKKQTNMIKMFNNSVNANKTFAQPVSSDVSPVISPEKKTVNLAYTISNLQNILEDTNKSSIDTDDDSRDEDLIIDMKEDEIDKINESKSANDKRDNEDLKDQLVCKHCQLTFPRKIGFKRHVQFSHLKRFGFLCPYCDRSTNSEAMMRTHIRSKHPNNPEKIIHNPNAWGKVRLTDEFWEKEYGLVNPRKNKRRKLNAEHSVSNNVTPTTVASATATSTSTNTTPSPESRFQKCELCNFTAANYAGLRSHMRTHTAPKTNFMCFYCKYTSSSKIEMVEHLKINHSTMQLKFKELALVVSPSSNETSKLSPQKRNIDASKSTEKLEASIIYGCVYCNLRSISMSSLKQHWNLMHKELKGSENTLDTKFPFKFKKIAVPKLTSVNSPKKEINEHNKPKQTENPTPVNKRSGWICQWCRELCETNSDRIRHQNMFHSHLQHKWEPQQQEIKEPDLSQGASLLLPASNAENPTSLATNSKYVPDVDLRIDSIVENLIVKHVNQTNLGDIKIENDQNVTSSVLEQECDYVNQVAKKSTAKSTVSKPGPRIFKAVARKSTNPRPSLSFLTRMSSEHTINIETEENETKHEPFSYYGIPSSPVNLAKLNTYMVVGGHNMRVNCRTLATLINIEPKVLLEDISKNPKYAANFSNLN